jgi:hypothetical protein
MNHENTTMLRPYLPYWNAIHYPPWIWLFHPESQPQNWTSPPTEGSDSSDKLSFSLAADQLLSYNKDRWVLKKSSICIF